MTNLPGEIESILSHRKVGDKIKYQIHWKGYSIEDSTWEPEERFDGKSKLILTEYKKQHLSPNKSKSKQQSQMIGKKRNKKTKGHNDIIEDDEDEIEGLLGKDKPIRIVSAKKHKDLPTELLCEIEWKVRKDGTQPKNSFYKNEDIKKKEPLILVEFYEKHLVFPSRQTK
jgi:hypothetical protein